MNPDWQALAGEHDLVSRREVLVEVPGHVVGNAASRGRLRTVQRGLYVPVGHEVSAITRAAAACAVLQDVPAVASHTTAARVHGLPVPEAETVEHVTVPRWARRRHHAALHLHTCRLDVCDTIDVDGVSVTSGPRTVVDLIRSLDRWDAAWATDRALHHRLVTSTTVLDAAGRVTRATGVARVPALVATAEPRSRSWLETRGRLVLLDAGLPRPQAQIPVQTWDGTKYLDLGYPEHRIGIEMDGSGPHSDPGAVYADRGRQNLVHVRGWGLLRFTYFDVVRRPEWMVQCVRAKLADPRRGT